MWSDHAFKASVPEGRSAAVAEMSNIALAASQLHTLGGQSRWAGEDRKDLFGQG